MKFIFWPSLLLIVLSFKTRIPNPTHWQYTIVHTTENTYELHVLSTIDEGWHIYSQTQPAEAICIPTKISVTNTPLVTLVGKPTEIGTKEKYEDKTAGIIQYQYTHQVEFVQKITLKAQVKVNLTGTITFQVCNEQECLPEKTIPFTVAIP